MKQTTRSARRKHWPGQALIEFVVLLTVLILFCSGMIWLAKILELDWWAQQEARYIAFEKTWAPKWRGSSPRSELQDSQKFGRPLIVDRASVQRGLRIEGGLNELLSTSDAQRGAPIPSPTPTFTPTPTPTHTPHQVCRWVGSGKSRHQECRMVIGQRLPAMRIPVRDTPAPTKPFWEQKTDEWFEDDSAVAQAFSLVGSAHAKASLEHGGLGSFEQGELPHIPEAVAPFEKGIRELLAGNRFGKRVCTSVRRYLKEQGVPGEVSPFTGNDCAKRQNSGFAAYASQHIDIPALMKDFEWHLEQGTDAGESLNEALRQEFSSMYGSYFEDALREGTHQSLSYILGARLELARHFVNPDIQRMIREIRFVGTSVALGLVGLEFGRIVAQRPLDYSPDHFVSLEQSVSSVLHADAAHIRIPHIPLHGSGFWFSPTLLPIPPFWGRMGPGMFAGGMENVLSLESHEIDRVIHNSNVDAAVEYSHTSRLGIDNSRYRWETDIRLQGRFYLVTEPWHLTRRTGPTGAWRAVGSQTDELGSSSEEGMMRQRITGLWLLPSDPIALFDPIIDAIPTSMGNIINAFRGVKHFIVAAKGFMTDQDPLLRLLRSARHLPVIGQLIPQPPEWPAVRPQAYPGSDEFSNDKLTGKQRSFDDYVEEQKKFK